MKMVDNTLLSEKKTKFSGNECWKIHSLLVLYFGSPQSKGIVYRFIKKVQWDLEGKVLWIKKLKFQWKLYLVQMIFNPKMPIKR